MELKHTKGYKSVADEVWGNESAAICSWCEHGWPCEGSEAESIIMSVLGMLDSLDNLFDEAIEVSLESIHNASEIQFGIQEIRKVLKSWD